MAPIQFHFTCSAKAPLELTQIVFGKLLDAILPAVAVDVVLTHELKLVAVPARQDFSGQRIYQPHGNERDRASLHPVRAHVLGDIELLCAI